MGNALWATVLPRLAVFLSVVALIAGCSDLSMRGDVNGKLKLDTKLDGAVRIEGPIVMQVRGPTVRYRGVYISENTLERVHTSETRMDWVLAVFGEPTDKTRLADGSDIWKWAYVPMEQEASIVSVFGGSKDEPALQPSTTYLHLKDGVVIEKWRD